MGTAFKAFFAFITQLFSGAEQLASAFNNVSTWANESSGSFADRARYDREQDLEKMYKELGITELPKTKTKATPVAVA